jgi:hypothetical protein
MAVDTGGSINGFTSSEITTLGYIALDHYLRNKPIDQIGRERPFLAKLMKGKKVFPGGKSYIVEQVRKSYDSNFQWYFGSEEVTYNQKDTTRQTNFPWSGCHDGFSLNEDVLLANGITLTDNSGPSTNSGAEMLQLTNLFEENIETLRLGFEEMLDRDLHVEGADPNAISGLDHLVALDPTVGTVGGIDRATNEWWRNSAVAGSTDIVNDMEGMWRELTMHGGRPDFILAGSAFVDAFRDACKDEIARYTILKTTGQNAEFDPSVNAENTSTGLHFQNTPIVWDPTMDSLDAESLGTSGVVPYANRCYMLNTKHLTLRPAAGHDMIARKPERMYNSYQFYWALTFKGALTMNRANAHGVISI